MGDACRDVLDIVPETVVLAFDVAGWSKTSDARLIASKKEIVEAMTKAVAAEGKRIAEKHFKGQAVTGADGLEMLEAAGKAFLDDRQNELKRRVMCAYKESPLGVWLDKHEWILYVVLPLVVGGAGTYMYVARVGDAPAKWASSFAKVKKSWNVQHLGKLTFGADDVSFVPSKREITAKVFGKAEWERLAITVKIGGGMSDGEVSPASVSAAVETAITRGTTIHADTTLEGLGGKFTGKSSLGVSYKGSGAGSPLTLDLKGVVAYDRDGLTSFGGAASAGVRGKVLDMPTTLGVESGFTQHLRDESKAPQEVNLTVKLSVDW